MPCTSSATIASVSRSGVGLRAQLAEKELGKRLRLAGQLLDPFLAVAADIRVRVFALGKKQEAQRLMVERERQAHVQGAPGCLAASGVAVEAEHQLVGELEKLRDVYRRGRG